MVSAEPGQRTAAELGFDDSRYERQPGQPGQLDPVGRSLLREERRAQLEAAAADRQDEADLPQQRQDETGAYDERQPGYDGGYGYEAAGDGYPPTADGYPSDQNYDPDYQQQGQQQGQQQAGQGYGQGFQPPYEPAPQNGFFGAAGQSYQGAYDGGYDQSYQGGDGQPAQQSYDPAYGQAGQNGYDPAYQATGDAAEFPGYPSAQGDWTGAEPEVAESVPPLPQQAPESVVSPSLTDSGLPRRDRRQHPPQEPKEPQESPEPAAQESPGEQNPPQPDESDWRSTNDEHWQRAESVREPKAGGVTPSGLPRRVPKANLVPGAATQTPQGGPQVSRAPEDVRGRLSNLRRGVQQGRTAGTDTNGQATDSRFGGPQNQER